MRKKISNFRFEKFVFFLFLFALALISAKSAAAQTIMSDSENILEIKASSTPTKSIFKFLPSTSISSFSLQAIANPAVGASTISIFEYLSSNSLFKMLNGVLNFNPSNNFIGIGTTAPRSKLEVNGDILIPNGNSLLSRNFGNNTSVPLFKFDSTDALSIGTWEGSYVGNTYIKGGNGSVFVDFSQGNNANFIVRKVSGTTPTELMRVTTAGNVGIGTTTPAAGLEVLTGSNYSILAGGKRVGNVAAPVTGTDAVNRNYVDSNFIASTSLPTIINTNAFVQGGNSFGVKAILGTNDNQALGIETNGTEKMTILANGNVGIGTTNPTAKLHFKASSVSYGAGGIRFEQSADTTYWDVMPAYDSLFFGHNGGTYYTMTTAGLELGDGGSIFTYLARSGNSYFNAGNVGIGLTNPDSKLQINGSFSSFTNANVRHYYNVAAYDSEPTTGTMVVTLPKYGSYTMLSVKISGYDYTDGRGYWEVLIGGYNYGDHNWYSKSVEFTGTPPFTTVRLANNGTNDLILLGNTSTSWQYPKVTVSDVIVGYSNPENWGTGWSMNVVSSEPALSNVSTLTPKSFFDASGYLGIGTTAPGYKLDVAGEANFGGNQVHGVSAPTLGTDAANRNYVDGFVTTLNSDKLTAKSISYLDTNTIGDNFVLYGGSTGAWTNRGPSGHNGGAILHIPTHPGGYYSDMWFDTANNRIYSRVFNNGVIGGWALLPKVSSATTNYLTKYVSDDSIGNSIIFDNGTNVGIGTTAPGAYKLYVNGATYTSGNLNTGGNLTVAGDAIISGSDVYNNSGDLHLSGNRSLYFKMDYNNDDADIRNIIFAKNTALGTVPTGVNELMRITETGNVGIGLDGAAPTQKLYVKGDASFGNSVIHDVSAPVTSTDAVNRYYVDSNFAPITSQTWKLNGSNLYASSTTWNVGIGNNAPAQKLDVTGSINSSAGYKVNNSAVSGNYLRGNGSNFVASTIQAGDVPTLNQNTSGYAGYLISEDNRSISPSELARNMMKFGFTSYKNDNSYPYADFLHFNSYADSSGGNDNLLVFNKRALGMRLYQEVFGSASPYTKYKDVVLAENTPAANYLTKYSTVGDEVTVAASSIYDNGTYVGIGTTTPQVALDVNGLIKMKSSNITTTSDVINKGYLDSALLAYGSSNNFWKLNGNNLYSSSTAWNVGIGTTNPGTNKLYVNGTTTINGALNVTGTATTTIAGNTMFTTGVVGIGGLRSFNDGTRFHIDLPDGINGTFMKFGYANNSAFIDTLGRWQNLGPQGFQEGFMASDLTINPSGGSVSFGAGDNSRIFVSDGTIYNWDSSQYINVKGTVLPNSILVSSDIVTTHGSLKLPYTTNATPEGIIFKQGNRFIHDFNYGVLDNGLVTIGKNTFVGINAGNLSMGSTAKYNYHSSHNTGIGVESLYSNTTGYENTAIGANSLTYNNTGSGNTANGAKSLYSNTTGNLNTAGGDESLYFNDTGSHNTAIGRNSLRSNTTGMTNVAVGSGSGQSNITGSSNVFLGANANPASSNNQNSIVIGSDAQGAGSNSVVLGNDYINRTYLRGNVGINYPAYTSLSYTLDVIGDIRATGFVYDSSDERIKHDIKSLDNADYQKILKLRPVSFFFNSDNRKGLGFIAQEVEKIYPEIVSTDQQGGMKSVSYINLISPAIVAIQEQQKKIDEQDTLIHILLDRVNKLEKK